MRWHDHRRAIHRERWPVLEDGWVVVVTAAEDDAAKRARPMHKSETALGILVCLFLAYGLIVTLPPGRAYLAGALLHVEKFYMPPDFTVINGDRQVRVAGFQPCPNDRDIRTCIVVSWQTKAVHARVIDRGITTEETWTVGRPWWKLFGEFPPEIYIERPDGSFITPVPDRCSGHVP